jgi:hypothetical protein
MATSEDEHAVSTVILGPSNPKAYESLPDAEYRPLVLVDPHADVHTGPRSRERLDNLTGISERFRGDFEQEALLRIHQLRFTRRNVEKPWIEPLDVLEEPALAAADFTPGAANRIVQVVNPEAIGGQIGNRIDSIAQQPPQLGRTGGLRKSASDADDGDRLALTADRDIIHGSRLS